VVFAANRNKLISHTSSYKSVFVGEHLTPLTLLPVQKQPTISLVPIH